MQVEQYPFLSGQITLFYSKQGLKFVSLAAEPLLEYTNWFEPATFTFATEVQYAKLVQAYLNHQALPDFTVDWQGTKLQEAVWQYLRRAPSNKTLTYSQLATALGYPQAVRAVASAVGKNPILVLLACHRILLKDGSIGQYRAGVTWKRELLAFEGLI
ncbi:methylated-DNA-[protein]-cysteine methyltransferase [Weissella oryzae SG25]|uniref:Methylated-DNA-[protein]-cysteine methyltransferase n=1 Tax=Weissella oryzae (strain DSM 25784 / JCM 18191 / LMG 30913 / SG25) TaxID=1329250 RepID=A0A069CT43_WEIOS|nr:MGMT family protein [Weissella oryzae]GAK30572.1 methylated-DNA-[protein]-cysteine methyltransferase [Weissella oryzae SG25]